MSVKISKNTLLICAFIAGIILAPTITYFLAIYGIKNPFDPNQYQNKNVYIADDGTEWASYQAYIDYLKSQGQPLPTPASEVSVIRHIDWQVVDDLAGGGIANVYIYVYDSQLRKFEGDGSAYKTGTDGTLESGISYRSGDQLKVELVKSNAKGWYSFTVPKMASEDAQVITVNPVTLRFFTEINSTTAPTFTLNHQGTAIADAGEYNVTTSGTTRTFTFSIFNNDDNTGFIESYDPLNEIDWWCEVYLKQYTGNYADISLSGWDGSYEKGSAMYYYKHVTATGTNGISKYKVGNSYIWSGSWSFSFTGDFTGYSGDTTDWDIFVYIYTDPVYYQQKSSFGPDSVQLGSTFDVDIVD